MKFNPLEKILRWNGKEKNIINRWDGEKQPNTLIYDGEKVSHTEDTEIKSSNTSEQELTESEISEIEASVNHKDIDLENKLARTVQKVETELSLAKKAGIKKIDTSFYKEELEKVDMTTRDKKIENFADGIVSAIKESGEGVNSQGENNQIDPKEVFNKEKDSEIAA